MNFWDELFRIQGKQQAQRARAKVVLQADDLPWEINRQGKMRWYIHPSMPDRCHQALMAYVQEIPPGSRSGKVRHQGGMAFYVWKGNGYSVINDKKHEWEQDDTILLPVSIEYDKGVTYQHFNGDKQKSAFLLAVSLNEVDSLGVDLGIGLEQLEDCPEYEASSKKVAARVKRS